MSRSNQPEVVEQVTGMSSHRGHKSRCVGGCLKLPEQARSATMLWLENISLLFQRHHTHNSSQRRVRGRYGDVLYQGRGTHLPGMDRELSGTDRKCAWWPSKTTPAESRRGQVSENTPGKGQGHLRQAATWTATGQGAGFRTMVSTPEDSGLL